VRDNKAERKREPVIDLEEETEGNTMIRPELAP
jgi:hypothetical protein